MNKLKEIYLRAFKRYARMTSVKVNKEHLLQFPLREFYEILETKDGNYLVRIKR